MVLARGPVFAPSVSKKVNTVGLAWTLWKKLQPVRHWILLVTRSTNGRKKIDISQVHVNSCTGTSSHNVGRVMELAGLSKFASAVFEVILARRFVGTNWKLRLIRVAWCIRSTGWVMVFARFAVFASPGSNKVSAIGFAFSLWILVHGAGLSGESRLNSNSCIGVELITMIKM